MKTDIAFLLLAFVACRREDPSTGHGGTAPAVKSAQSTTPKTALDICRALEKQGAASGCVAAQSDGASEFNPGGSASDAAEFALPATPQSKGKVMIFATDSEFKKARIGYAELKGLAVHTFSSEQKRVIIWQNADATKEESKAAEKIVETL